MRGASPFPRPLPEAAQQALSISAAAEEIAAEIHASKRELIDLDRRRQQTMEAVAQFRVRPGKASAVSVEGKSWACLGSFFVQLPSEQVLDMLQQDRTSLDAQIASTRSRVKQQLLLLQRFSPSELSPALLHFALREAQRVREGKETEMDERDDDEVDDT